MSSESRDNLDEMLAGVAGGKPASWIDAFFDTITVRRDGDAIHIHTEVEGDEHIIALHPVQAAEMGNLLLSLGVLMQGEH